MNRVGFGKRYILPARVVTALDKVFGEPVSDVRVIEFSPYARMHLGMSATTRPNRILLAIAGSKFVEDPDMLLHEYYHVLRQWANGRLTRWRYLAESARRGYWHNTFEREARNFSASAVATFRAYLTEI